MAPTLAIQSGEFHAKRESSLLEPPDVIMLQSNQLFSLRMEGHLCDIVVKVQESMNVWVDFAAHKVVLVATSPFFRMLYDKNNLLDIVKMPATVGAMAFSLLLDVLYGKPLTMTDIQSITSDIVSLITELLSLSTLLKLDEITAKLENWRKDAAAEPLKPMVKQENCDQFFSFNGSMRLDLMNESRCKTEWDNESSPMDSQLALFAQTNFSDSNSDDGDNSNDETYVPPSSPPPRKRLKPTVSRVRKRSVMKKSTGSKVKRGPYARKRKAVPGDCDQEDQVGVDSSTNGGDQQQASPQVFNDVNRQTDDVQAESTNSSSASVIQYDDSYPKKKHPELEAKFKAVSRSELRAMFQHHRDRLYLEKKRLELDVDEVEGTLDSWYKASERNVSFLGKNLSQANRVKRACSDEVVPVKGEVHGDKQMKNLELIWANGEKQTNIRVKRDGKSFDCPFCPEEEVWLEPWLTLVGHFLTVHHLVFVSEALVCELCSFVAFEKTRMKTHLLVYHKVKEKVGPSDATALCQLCGNVFPTKNSLRKHHEKVHGRKRIIVQSTQTWDCNICGAVFPSQYSHGHHMHKEHGEPYRFQCTQEGCDFGVNVRHSFTEHLFNAHKINVGDKPILKCSYCDYLTLREKHLQMHELTHTSHEYSFKCEHEGCKSVFKQWRHLRQHYTNCHGNLNLRCEQCGSGSAVYQSKKALQRHEESVHTVRQLSYKCGYCSYVSAWKHGVKAHTARIHKELEPIIVDLRKADGVPPPQLACNN